MYSHKQVCEKCGRKWTDHKITKTSYGLKWECPKESDEAST